MAWQTWGPDRNEGFMLWEVIMACGVLAMVLQALMGLSLAMMKAKGHLDHRQVAQYRALSVADQLAAGYALVGQVPFQDALLHQGVACLSEHPPWRLISVRWQAASGALPTCEGPWPLAQQLCLNGEVCE